MNNAQLIGTSFEYAEISKTSARIANDMVSLMQLLTMYEVPHDEIYAIVKTHELMTKYHFTYTQSSLLKKLENNLTP